MALSATSSQVACTEHTLNGRGHSSESVRAACGIRCAYSHALASSRRRRCSRRLCALMNSSVARAMARSASVIQGLPKSRQALCAFLFGNAPTLSRLTPTGASRLITRLTGSSNQACPGERSVHDDDVLRFCYLCVLSHALAPVNAEMRPCFLGCQMAKIGVIAPAIFGPNGIIGSRAHQNRRNFTSNSSALAVAHKHTVCLCPNNRSCMLARTCHSTQVRHGRALTLIRHRAWDD